MTARRRPSPAVQLARDVLHADGCGRLCERCRARDMKGRGPDSDYRDMLTLARALLRATKEPKR
jgi:hypothetical protein